jgi:molybdopterin synthase catalytic subunit
VRVNIRLFAGLRQNAGTDAVSLELPDGSSVRDALTELRWLIGDTRVVMAVNREYASDETLLQPEDELALIPPVSGGAVDSVAHARISPEPLAAEQVTALVTDPRAGAVVTFLGVTREVPALEYEAYVEMAHAKLLEIVAAAVRHHDLCRAAAEHRVGTVALSEPSVVVAASAPHREQAFAGAREIIDTIKAQAPIWKREEGLWVAGSEPGA